EKWLLLAAKEGHISADFELGRPYIYQLQQQDKALPYLKAAAEKGYVDAQYELGLLLTSGAGVPVNYPEDVQWWRAATDQSHMQAEYQLGLLYEQGLGVSVDL
ncbi:tetratricopeptide repeat protein, partial [Lysinibacillus sp. D4A3_S15]|uniref:tetratricopeptide repeat protein n=1 Tax=Lysinibacillus sp. D4A3_S15 TaxID=2941227 RepID=UPI0020C165A5